MIVPKLLYGAESWGLEKRKKQKVQTGDKIAKEDGRSV